MSVAAFWHSVKTTGKEIKASPCSYCLGVCSVFLVVTVAAIVYTLISIAPLIFLREAEATNGQIDTILTSYIGSSNYFLNYTQFVQSLAAAPSPYNAQYSFTAPRLYLPAVQIWRQDACPSSITQAADVTPMYIQQNGNSCGRDTCLSWQCAELDPFEMPRPTMDGLQIVLIDSDKESNMRLGRSWPFGVIPKGGVIITSGLAAQMGGLRAGDAIYATIPMAALLRNAFATTTTTTTNSSTTTTQATNGSATAATTANDAVGWQYLVTGRSTLAAKLIVAGVLNDGAHGKVPNSEADVSLFMEFGTASAFIVENLHPLFADVRQRFQQQQQVQVPDLRWFAGAIVANLPPETRITNYANPNYDRVRAAVADFASTMLYVAGFTEVESDSPLLTELESRRFVTLYLGLVLDVLLIILFTLSVILIYSLLLVNAESRQFELAIRRMLGTRRIGIVSLLATQAAAYGIPAWILGLILAQIGAAIVLRSFSNISSIPVSLQLTGQSIGAATALALAIPAVSAIGPIRGALKRNIREALDAHRPKATAIKYSLTRSDDGTISKSAIIVGVSMSLFGFALYYLLPLALLSTNLSLFFNLFLAIILGMLAGLILLALNVELLLLQAVGWLTIKWWEKAAVWSILVSNITAGHRKRNRKTIIMYALSIAFIVFISAAASAQIQAATYTNLSRRGASLTVGNEESLAPPDPAVIKNYELALRQRAAALQLKGAAWTTMRLDASMQGVLASYASGLPNATTGITVSASFLRNVGRSQRQQVTIFGVGPRFYGLQTEGMYAATDIPGATFTDFLSVEKGPTPDVVGIPLSKFLFTTKGTQGALISNSLVLDAFVDQGSDLIIQTTGTGTSSLFGTLPSYARSRLNVAASLAGTPGFRASRGPSNANAAFVSMPTMVHMIDSQFGYDISGGLQRVKPSAIKSVWEKQTEALMQRTTSTEVRAALQAALNGTFTEFLATNVRPSSAEWQEAWPFLVLLYSAASPASEAEFQSVYHASQGAISIDDVPLRLQFVNVADGGKIQRLAPETIVDVVAQRRASGFGSGIIAQKDAYWSSNAASAGAEDTTVLLLELFFAVLALVAMVLCFFSLMASMITNINEQRHEIGIMMSLGLKSYHLIRVYIEEAFLLVLSSSLLGVVIGSVIAWTFGQQQSLFTAIPMPFVLPWGIITVIFIASIVMGIVAACAPARRLMKLPITALLRGE